MGTKKLELNRETIRQLDDSELDEVVGGVERHHGLGPVSSVRPTPTARPVSSVYRPTPTARPTPGGRVSSIRPTPTARPNTGRMSSVRPSFLNRR